MNSINSVIRIKHLREGAVEMWQARSWSRLVLLLLLMLISLGQLQRWQITASLAIYAHDLLLMLWAVSLAAQPAKIVRLGRVVLSSWKKTATTTKYLLLSLLALALVRWLGVVTRPDELVPALLYTGRLLLYAAGIWSLAQDAQLPWFVRRAGFMVAGLLMTWLGICQYFLLPDTRFLSILGWDDHLNRLIGPVFDPNFMGILIVITAWYAWSVREFFPPKVMWTWLTALGAAVIFTLSRASYLATAGSLLVGIAGAQWGWQWGKTLGKSWLLRAGILVLVAALVAILYPRYQSEGLRLTRTVSVTARYTASAAWLEQLSGLDWLAGRGLFVAPRTLTKGTAVAAADTANWPDNSLVLSLSSWGIVGTVLALLLGGQWLVFIWKKDRSLALALVAVCIHSLFNHTIFEPFVWLMIWGGVTSLPKA